MFQRIVAAVFPCILYYILYEVVAEQNEGRCSKSRYAYCLVGAGPAGLQMAYFLDRTSRDYVVFEQADSPGTFFTTYPRHRRLISINKRYTGRSNKEFNLRHDWNSLLSHDESLLFKHYSPDYFPNANTMLRYLNDYHQKLRLNVCFHTQIGNISRSSSPNERSSFQMQDQRGKSITCKVLVVASGFSRANQVQFEGSHLTTSYEDVSTDPSEFENKSLLILGRGNSAFETADVAYGKSNFIHMVARSRARLSWSTHYVGDLRGVNNAILDSYQLKSLDGLFEVPVQQLSLKKVGDQIFVNRRNHSSSEEDLRDNFSLREGYDMVVQCLGFAFDDRLFHRSLKPVRCPGRKRKYPAISPTFESVNIAGLYFAGTLSHSLDFRRSAGGFIHGFRYSIRALHRIFETRYEGHTWPSRRLPLVELPSVLAKRMNEASALYQMFATLGDIAIIRKSSGEFVYLEEVPLRLLPVLKQTTGHDADQVVVLNMEYGELFSGPGRDTFQEGRATSDVTAAHKSNFLHPVFYYYDKIPTEQDFATKTTCGPLPKPRNVHHTLEDFLTRWTSDYSHLLPLRRFLETSLEEDLRSLFAEDCLQMSLTVSVLPLTCQSLIQTGSGISNEGLEIL